KVSSPRAVVLPPNDALEAGTRLGEYLIASLLQRDSFALTYQARDSRVERDVVITEYLPTSLAARRTDQSVLPLSPRRNGDFRWGRDRFLTEARTLVDLGDTPGVVGVLDCLEANGTAYVVTALVQGETLAERLVRDGKLPSDAIEPLLRPLLTG